MRRFIPIALALTCAGIAKADYTPIPLTADSFNVDLIVEKSAPACYPVTTATVDGGTNNNGNTWYEIGFNTAQPDSGIPHPSTPFTISGGTNVDHTFALAPDFTKPNAIMLDASITKATFTFTNPASYTALSLLTSGGNGGCYFKWTVHHQDGSVDSNGSTQFGSPDWYGTETLMYISHGRVDAQGFGFQNATPPDNQYPRLFCRDFTVSPASPITSVDLEYVSSGNGAHTVYMAISGATEAGAAFAPIGVTGYNYDVIVEAGANKPTSLSAYATANLDNGPGTSSGGSTWYEQGFDPAAPLTGIPGAGTILTSVTSPDHKFVMPSDYTVNNAVMIDQANFPYATITPVTPKAFSGLSFLSSCSHGPVTLLLVVHHADGNSESVTTTSLDWYNGPAAYIANGRVDVGNSVPNTVNGNNPRLYASDIALTVSPTSPITSIDVAFSTGDQNAHVGLLAVSGVSGAVKPIIDPQPQSVLVSSGSDVSFTVGVAGTSPFNYQWQKSTTVGTNVFVNVTDGGKVSGAKTATLNITGATVADIANLQVIVGNSAGYSTSSVATLTVISPLPSVAVNGVNVVGYKGNWPGAETPDKAMDGTTSKYLNFGQNGGSPFKGPVGIIVTPKVGPTIAGAIRFYTANDASERDPADFTLEGSNDGVNYSVISSNALSLSTARNGAGVAIDPLTQTMQQVVFNNTSSYTIYRITVNNVRNNSGANSMQIGEIELLGAADTSGRPYFTTSPNNVTTYAGGNVQFKVVAAGTPAPTYQWKKGSVDLVDGGNISGAKTATLSINNVSAADVADYVCVANNSVATVTSTAGHLTMLSSLQNILVPTDAITAFGNWTDMDPTNVAPAIDGSTAKFNIPGHGLSAERGFAPFVGPVGLVITPSAGKTLVTGLRVFASDNTVNTDPANYTLEGSNDDGANYTIISTGNLSIPLDRNGNNATNLIDPLSMSLQEVLFNNRAGYTSYRVTFTNTRDDISANSLQIAELQLLGIPAPNVNTTTMAIKVGTDGKITISCDVPGELYSTTALKDTGTAWTDEGPINGTLTITPVAGTPAKFYIIK